MSEIVDHSSITQTRESFVQGLETQRWEDRQRTRKLAREMVIAMTGRQGYTTEDFMFAASLGEPERYPNEGATLKLLAQLPPGKIVGVVSEDILRAVGVTADKPLEMKVDVRTPSTSESEQYNRQLEAHLNLISASRRATEDHKYPKIDVEVHPEPKTISILRAWGEPSYDGSVFYEPQSVVVGAEAIMSHLESDDTIGKQQVADYLTHLAGIAFINHIVVTRTS